MELSVVETETKRQAFFSLVYGQYSGYMCVAFLKDGKFREEFYHYPEELPKAEVSIQEKTLTHNVYFCPQLLSEKKRSKGCVKYTPNIWSDLDSCPPGELYVEPTMVLETSPGRFQALWSLEDAVDPDDAENLSRRIAYAHADQGADRSGWDLTQLLRVPMTYNFKYGKGSAPLVTIIDANRNLYRVSDFVDYPETPDYVKTDIPMPNEEDLPPVAEDLLQARRKEINPLIWRYFVDEPIHDWSKALWNLEMLLFETGFTREEVFVICREAKCNKYARDGRSMYLLWKEVCRADIKAALHEQLLTDKPEKHIYLLSPEERREVEQQPDTFVERYIEWASSLGDAAVQYHQAGAFICLSSMLCGSVRLPTSFGTIIPNLWFMILADTTLTRKSTAMDIAMDLLVDTPDGGDLVMATDGSIEGMMSALASRAGRPSIFLRDEFSGLLEQMTKKDYMAGMAELLTKLYDGKMQKRILRKEVIEVRDPRLVLFAGGIKNKITGLMTFEQVSSGFMPRFVFITAESDIKRVRPIGPPTKKTTGNRDAILAELTDIGQYYNRTQELHIKKLDATIKQNVVFDAELTDEAWIRYNELETTLLQAGLDAERPEIMTPVGDRLAKSILKAAVLIAAARQKSEGVKVERSDIIRAIMYGERWRTYADDIMENVGKGTDERRLDTILGAIKKKEGGISRSQLMQSYHLSARDANFYFETLEQRGLITKQKSGRTELLIAR